MPSGEVLYVGKARGLKKRVQSYARAGSHNNRIAAMIANTASMEFVTTPTETEALLLEANLIKRLKPRYNVVLRDDKSFPFILIARDHDFPQILKHRGARSRKGDYFGPFASAGAVGRTINTLQRAFLLRSCSDAYFETRLRPCLLYQIKRCSAPCTGEISDADYAALVDEALRFLTGESDEVKRRMHKLMDDASLKQDYERAASFRDRLTALSNVQSHQGINPQNVKDADVFSAHQEAGQTAIQVFFFRTGNNWGNRAYFPARRQIAFRGRSARILRGAVLRRQAAAEARPAVPRDRGPEIARRGLVLARRPQDQGRGAAAWGKARAGKPCAGQCARGFGPPPGGVLIASRDLRPARRAVRPRGDARSASKCSIIATFPALIRSVP